MVHGDINCLSDTNDLYPHYMYVCVHIYMVQYSDLKRGENRSGHHQNKTKRNER